MGILPDSCAGMMSCSWKRQTDDREVELSASIDVIEKIVYYL